MALSIINTILYPYAQYAWDRISGAIRFEPDGTIVYVPTMTDAINLYILKVTVIAIWKVTKVLALWFFAVLAAPVGLLYLKKDINKDQ